MSPSSHPCAACGSTDTEAFHSQHSIPTNSCLLLADREEAESYPTGDMELRFCRNCGFIGNALFDPALSEYSSRYEETQGFSERFNDFARDLAKRWVDKYSLAGRTVLEIGCGKGEFLEMMCEAGVGHGIGIDPSAHPDRLTSEAASRIEWITDRYSEKYSDLSADAVVCRHTLEHISDVGDFMRMVRASIGDRLDTVVLFELPDVKRVLEEVAFWDVYYEHCSYFSAGSLARLFRATGFEVLEVGLEYDDQYLIIEARPSAVTPAPGEPFGIEDDMEDLAAAVSHFGESYTAMVDKWRSEMTRRASAGERAVIWGAGSKGVAYLTALGLGDEVPFAVDINPHKHGMYMAGTGQRIVAPEQLRTDPPDLVVVMNPVYLDEIGSDVRGMGLDAQVVAV
ncbi:MAG: methyltransferase domain-containing protein [Microthrixaceae bacterium]|nr:methyltransferase domain-containing protein [Microthrixaceae bacterium]